MGVGEVIMTTLVANGIEPPREFVLVVEPELFVLEMLSVPVPRLIVLLLDALDDEELLRVRFPELEFRFRALLLIVDPPE